MNTIHLCDCHGVLYLSAGDSCIGDLYSQKNSKPLSLMEVVKLTESVLALSGNCFIVLQDSLDNFYNYSQLPTTAHVKHSLSRWFVAMDIATGGLKKI